VITKFGITQKTIVAFSSVVKTKMDGKVPPVHVEALAERPRMGKAIAERTIDKDTIKGINYSMEILAEEGINARPK